MFVFNGIPSPYLFGSFVYEYLTSLLYMYVCDQYIREFLFFYFNVSSNILLHLTITYRHNSVQYLEYIHKNESHYTEMLMKLVDKNKRQQKKSEK